jgi:hypothetical protein
MNLLTSNKLKTSFELDVFIGGNNLKDRAAFNYRIRLDNGFIVRFSNPTSCQANKKFHFKPIKRMNKA